MIFNKIAKMTKKVFSSKTYILLLINRFIPKDFGEMVDLEIDRAEKHIFMTLHKKNMESNINIISYAIVYEGDKAFLTFKKLESTGYAHTYLRDMVVQNKIRIEPHYVKLVQRII